MNLAQIDFAAASRSKCSSCHAGHQDHRAGIDLGAAPADAAGGGGGHDGERGDEVGREILVVEPRHVQLAGRDHGGRAAVHVIADPADGVLGRRPFAEHRMDMAVDQARHDGAAAGVEHRVGLGVGRRIERRDLAAVDQAATSPRPAACAMSPVKNSPMFLMRSVDTGVLYATDRVQCLCAADAFSKAAFFSGDASFWCFAFHCSNGSP